MSYVAYKEECDIHDGFYVVRVRYTWRSNGRSRAARQASRGGTGGQPRSAHGLVRVGGCSEETWEVEALYTNHFDLQRGNINSINQKQGGINSLLFFGFSESPKAS